MSLEPIDQRLVLPVIRTLRIVVGAMLAGSVALCAVALAVQHGDLLEGRDPVSVSLGLTYIASAYAVAALLARFLIPGMMVNQAVRKIAQGAWTPSAGGASAGSGADEGLARAGAVGMLCTVFSQRTVVAAAIVEGAVLFALVAYVLEGKVLALVAAGLAFLALAQLFPTAGGAQNWIAEQLGRLEFERRAEPRPQ